MPTEVEGNGSDLARYRELIKTIDIADDQKDEVIQIVQSIMRAFVDVAFQIHPAQAALRNHKTDSSQPDSSCDKVPFVQQIQSLPAPAIGGVSDSGT